jgi:hypothetical protein
MRILQVKTLSIGIGVLQISSAKIDGMKYDYVRVSTDDQNPALQLAALKKAGCKAIFRDDGISGAIRNRPALSRCLTDLSAQTSSSATGQWRA